MTQPASPARRELRESAREKFLSQPETTLCDECNGSGEIEWRSGLVTKCHSCDGLGGYVEEAADRWSYEQGLEL